jgi:cephalosporin hydroxylase
VAGSAVSAGQESPKTAVQEFLRSTDRFEVDRDIENKLLLTACPGGYLQCIKD